MKLINIIKHNRHCERACERGNPIITLLSIILLIFCIISCSEAKPEGTIVATVNNEVLTLETLKASYGEETWNQKSIQEQRQIINQWINLTLLYNYAKQNPVINSLALNHSINTTIMQMYTEEAESINILSEIDNDEDEIHLED